MSIFKGRIDKMTYYYDSVNKNTSYELGKVLVRLIKPYNMIEKNIIILCIGSDRSTGDSLGPLIGYKLSSYCIPGITVYGTLSEPVHAVNLTEILDEINSTYLDPFIIAIDASLGSRDHVGYITVGTGPLRPGLGVNKELPAAGNIHITGIVNFSGMLDSLLLQTTRLSTVMELADVITRALVLAIRSVLTSDAEIYA
jgi:putative sporulation protein YyaC